MVPHGGCRAFPFHHEVGIFEHIGRNCYENLGGSSPLDGSSHSADSNRGLSDSIHSHLIILIYLVK